MRRSISPSWFVVVVDLLHPQKPVWLLGDKCFLFGLFTAATTKRKRTTVPLARRLTCEAKEMPYSPKEADCLRGEDEAITFLEKLAARKADLIKVFVGLEEWMQPMTLGIVKERLLDSAC
jgi:hypothetical protein